ncbi:hypothetical protein V8F20_006267 [Naviculisporaceae sp. PSN 640]
MKQLQLRLGMTSTKHIYIKPSFRPVLIRAPTIQQRSFHRTISNMVTKPAFSTTSPSTTPSSGYFQTITITHPKQHSSSSPGHDTEIPFLTITDTLYGTHTITAKSEPLLFNLLQSPYLTRLSGVHQHGITGLLGLTPPITRLEHSIGAFLIVRSLGASLSEQVAALLHDVSHTALSHVVDWALTSPGGESYHEVHKARYLDQSDLVDIVKRFASDLDLGRSEAGSTRETDSMDVFHEEKFPLIEYPAPSLCADRIDYALRDSVAFGKLSLEEARKVFQSLRAYPNTNSPDRLIVMDDEELALKFARAYNAIDRDVWSNPANIDMYKSTGRIIREVIRNQRGRGMEEEDLWRLSDKEFWERLREATDDEGRTVMKRMETKGLPRQEDVYGLPVGTKIRTLDPDVLVGDGSGSGYQPLSVAFPAWGVERGEYIGARKALIGLDRN